MLDERAVLACMAYVDLNPIRAMMAKKPETLEHTSIQKRTEAIQQHKCQPYKLLPFADNPRQDMPIIRADKADAIDSAQIAILSRLGLSVKQWITLTTEFEQHFCYAVGTEHMMKDFKIHTHRKRIGGMRQAKPSDCYRRNTQQTFINPQTLITILYFF